MTPAVRNFMPIFLSREGGLLRKADRFPGLGFLAVRGTAGLLTAPSHPLDGQWLVSCLADRTSCGFRSRYSCGAAGDSHPFPWHPSSGRSVWWIGISWLVWCLTNTVTNLRVLLAVGCVALPRVVHATEGRPPVAPTSHRALPTTKMPSHLHNRICETPH